MRIVLFLFQNRNCLNCISYTFSIFSDKLSLADIESLINDDSDVDPDYQAISDFTDSSDEEIDEEIDEVIDEVIMSPEFVDDSDHMDTQHPSTSAAVPSGDGRKKERQKKKIEETCQEVCKAFSQGW